MPRSIYAQKLLDFPDLVLADDAPFQLRGRWDAHFRERIGPTFNHRLIWEIGCFDAAYLASIAAKHPDTAFIGLDWKCKAIHDGAQRIASLSLRNVVLLRARAQDAPRLFAPHEIDEAWIFHPEPCDRPADLQNRLFADPFLTHLHPILKPAAPLCLKTDHPGYYQWALALLGLPEPAWFPLARSIAAGHQPASTPIPRTRARDLMPPDQLPPPSRAIQQKFQVTANSPDFWNDPAALAHTAPRPFAGEVTFYESRFKKKRLPIYYLELAPKCP